MAQDGAMKEQLTVLIGYRRLSVLLGIATLLTFGTERYLYETAGLTLGELPAVALGLVCVAVGVGSAVAARRDEPISTSLLLGAGPVGGLALYLVVYHLVLPPSTDSPTELIFLGFTGVFVVIAVGGHLTGRVSRRVERPVNHN